MDGKASSTSRSTPRRPPRPRSSSGSSCCRRSRRSNRSHRSRNAGALRARDARATGRGLRRSERAAARRAGARGEGEVTFLRERTYRRQTISEKIDAALEDAAKHQVTVGVDAAMATQFAARTRGDIDPNYGAYALASADLFFTAGIAQNTLFFADIVGLSERRPTAISDADAHQRIHRAPDQTELLNLREAWLCTEVLKNRLAITAGRLDLTNYFDANAVRQRREHAVHQRRAREQPDARPGGQWRGRGDRIRRRRTASASSSDSSRAARSRPVLGFALHAVRGGLHLYTLRAPGRTIARGSGPTTASRRHPQRLRPELRPEAQSGRWRLRAVWPVGDRSGSNDRFYSAGVSFQHGLIFNPEDTGASATPTWISRPASGAPRSRATTTSPHREAPVVVPSHQRCRYA